MNPVCETPCFTHGTGKNEVASHSTCCESFHRASPSAIEVLLEPYSTLNGMTSSSGERKYEALASGYICIVIGEFA